MRRIPLVLLLVLGVLAAGCGGGDAGQSEDPVSQVPAADGVREKVRAAQQPTVGEFPSAKGKTLQEVADEMTGGTELGLATSVFVSGRENRLAFGVIDETAGFLYGKTAVYIARAPGAPARGPFLAPADVLLTDPPYRSRQAATEEDPFAAIYAAEIPLPRAGDYSVLAATLVDGRPLGATGQITAVEPGEDRIPAVGDAAPKVETDTVASARGDLASIDTRQPPTRQLHQRSLDELIGKEPVALLFATPQLCASRVCGPVVDEALRLQARYGDRMAFIHQEVYVDNDVNKGLRAPLRAYNLRTEPWLFVIDRQGRVTARLEGSFGLSAFEQALQTAL